MQNPSPLSYPIYPFLHTPWSSHVLSHRSQSAAVFLHAFLLSNYPDHSNEAEKYAYTQRSSLQSATAGGLRGRASAAQAGAVDLLGRDNAFGTASFCVHKFTRLGHNPVGAAAGVKGILEIAHFRFIVKVL